MVRRTLSRVESMIQTLVEGDLDTFLKTARITELTNLRTMLLKDLIHELEKREAEAKLRARYKKAE